MSEDNNNSGVAMPDAPYEAGMINASKVVAALRESMEPDWSTPENRSTYSYALQQAEDAIIEAIPASQPTFKSESKTETSGPRVLAVDCKTVDEIADALEAIHKDVQGKIHDQWDWMDASFYVEQLRTLAYPVSSDVVHERIAELEKQIASLMLLVRTAITTLDSLNQTAITINPFKAE